MAVEAEEQPGIPSIVGVHYGIQGLSQAARLSLAKNELPADVPYRS
jgi:hypothetical protein